MIFTPTKITDVSIDAASSFIYHINLLGDAYIYENPGTLLDINDHNCIYDILIPLTSFSFGADMTDYWKSRKKEGYLKKLSTFVFLVESSSQDIIGWTGYHILNDSVLNDSVLNDSILKDSNRVIFYLDSTGIVPYAQSRGVISHIIKYLIDSKISNENYNKPIYVTARTESPVMYSLPSKLWPDATINPQLTECNSIDMLDTAQLMADWLGQKEKLEDGSFIIRNAYDMVDELYSNFPKSKNENINVFFNNHLGSTDAFIVVIKI